MYNQLVHQVISASSNLEEVEKLYSKALELIPSLQKQSTFDFLSQSDEQLLGFIKKLKNANITAVGAELIFGALLDKIGFSIIEDKIFRDLVISRIIYQGSKLKLVEEIAFNHTKKILGRISVVFYDMTTLYLEAQDEDDFRKIGFSKDGKFQDPQIMLGLLAGEKGYPIGYELFEGNTFGGKTLIPILEKFQKKFDLVKPIIVADSGLLSKANIVSLKKKGYEYIIGVRIKMIRMI